MNTTKSKLAMSRAWDMARKGQTIYGGPVKSFLREALRLAWADLNADPVMNAFDSMIADIRSGKIRRTYSAPYCVRNHGARSVTRWFANQGASP